MFVDNPSEDAPPNQLFVWAGLGTRDSGPAKGPFAHRDKGLFDVGPKSLFITNVRLLFLGPNSTYPVIIKLKVGFQKPK
jgi:hypothetical protein